jgi:hypothetical protein
MDTISFLLRLGAGLQGGPGWQQPHHAALKPRAVFGIGKGLIET